MIEARYIDLSEEIEKGIKQGRWQGRMPGVIKLSRELDANPATVSKAFKLLSEKGLLTIDGTRGTYITKHGSRTKHKVIGVIGIKPTSSYYAEEWEAMEAEARGKGYGMIGIAHSKDLFVEDKDMRLLLQFPVDGYIFMYSRLTFEIAAFLRVNGIPFVSCNVPVGIPGASWADFASERDFEKIMRYFISLGHKRIAYIDFHNQYYGYSERILNIYKKILTETGLFFDESLFFAGYPWEYYFSRYGEDYRRMYGAECARDIMKQRERPTAVLVKHPDMAYGLIEELKKYGLNVPGNVSVISYNSHFRQNEKVFLTTFFNDYPKRSSTAVKMLMDLFDNPDTEPKQELIEGRIIVGKSSSETGERNR